MAKTCLDCGAPADRLRKHRCDACYMRIYRNGEVSPGSRCAACGEDHAGVLLNSDVAGTPVVLCGNCWVVKARARPQSLSALISEVVRSAHAKTPTLLAGNRGMSAFRPRSAFDPSID